MNSEIIQKVKTYVELEFTQKLPPEFTYHNFSHTLKVRDAAIELAKKSLVNEEDMEVLELASLFHDLGMVESIEEHENAGKEIAEKFLEEKGFPKEKIGKVQELIEATKLEHEPVSLLEKIMKDADLCNLAETYYIDESNKLRHEWEYINNRKFEDSEWNEINCDFLKQHSYQTEAARILYGPQKLKNLTLLEGLMERNRKMKKAKKKKKKIKKIEPGNTISTNKGAQVQFKTALRNHIDLSAIADNKANIMLSVNALIITVALPIIANQVLANRNLLIPALILLVVCVTSMIYATLATRPISMKGYVSQEDIALNKSNLFFFGNFYKMSFNEYSSGITQIIADNKMLDDSITRDLFFLGKALGAKYRNLRLCYNIFMFGIIVAVLSFVTAFIITALSGVTPS